MMTADAVKTYALAIDDNGNIVGEAADRPDMEISSLISRYRVEHPEVSYEGALTVVRQAHPRLFAEYGSFVSYAEPPSPQGASDVAGEVDAIAREHMAEHDTTDYGSAVKTVLAEDPDLSKAYDEECAAR